MFKKVACLDEIWSGEMKGVVIDGQKILLVHIDDAVHAFEDRCVHQAVELSQGTLDGKVLTCFAHSWKYDVTNGTGINPKETQLKTFAVEVRNGEIYVDVNHVLKGRKGGQLG